MATEPQTCSTPRDEQQIPGCFLLWSGRAQKCAPGQGAASACVETSQQQQRARLSALIICASSCAEPWHPWVLLGWQCPEEERGSTAALALLRVLPLAGRGISCKDGFSASAVGAGCKGGDGYSQAHPTCPLHSQWGSGSVRSCWLLVSQRPGHSPTPAHPCSRSSMEHGWVNTSLLWCDSGCSVTGAKMAVPSHPDLSLAGLTLQGCPWVLGSTCRAGQAGAPAAAAVQKASSEPFLPKAHCCQHSQGVPAPSQRRMLHVQIWISTQTHLHMHKFCCGRAGPFAGLSPLITLQDVGS